MPHPTHRARSRARLVAWGTRWFSRVKKPSHEKGRASRRNKKVATPRLHVNETSDKLSASQNERSHSRIWGGGLMDRRTFTKGALAVGGAAAALAGTAGVASQLQGCSASNSAEETEPTYVEEGSQTSVIDTFTYVEDPPGLKETGSWTLPLGTVLHPSEGQWICATATGETTSPLVKACAFSLATGELKDVVPQPISIGRSQLIFGARCSDEVYAWCETNLSTGDWTLYAAPFSDGAITATPTTLWNANKEWDLPQFVCTGNMVVWQVMPTATGSQSKENSTCYVWHVGQPSATAAGTSPGRFATEPAVSEDIVTLTPRVRASEGVFYGIVAYSASDDLATVVDSMTLPQSIKPYSAQRMGEDFVFQVEANYSYGGLLGQMGTYLGKSGGPFVAVSREPSAAPCGKGPLLLVKSRSSYVDANLETEEYGVLQALDHSVDYGEYPARMGTCDTFVTFATIKSSETGYPAFVKVRAFELNA